MTGLSRRAPRQRKRSQYGVAVNGDRRKGSCMFTGVTKNNARLTEGATIYLGKTSISRRRHAKHDMPEEVSVYHHATPTLRGPRPPCAGTNTSRGGSRKKLALSVALLGSSLSRRQSTKNCYFYSCVIKHARLPNRIKGIIMYLRRRTSTRPHHNICREGGGRTYHAAPLPPATLQ